MGPAAGRTLLEDLSRELGGIAALLAEYAERDALRREAGAGAPVSVRQVQGLIAARHARSAAFDLDLANPGWSLLLELFRAHLEGRPARIARLATDAHVAATTALRWLDLFYAAGLAVKEADPGRIGGVAVRLTDAGAEAMEDYFAAARLGWIIG